MKNRNLVLAIQSGGTPRRKWGLAVIRLSKTNRSVLHSIITSHAAWYVNALLCFRLHLFSIQTTVDLRSTFSNARGWLAAGVRSAADKCSQNCKFSLSNKFKIRLQFFLWLQMHKRFWLDFGHWYRRKQYDYWRCRLCDRYGIDQKGMISFSRLIIVDQSEFDAKTGTSTYQKRWIGYNNAIQRQYRWILSPNYYIFMIMSL